MPKLPDWDLPDALENAIGDANEDAKAELDRLRAQKAEANNQWRLDYNACAAERDRQRTEINRLKAENAELKRMIRNFKPDYAPARDPSARACESISGG